MGCCLFNTTSVSSFVLSSRLFVIEPIIRDHVLPHIINLFTVHEVAIRQLLLQYWPHYVHLMDRDILHEEIIPEVRRTGLQVDDEG